MQVKITKKKIGVHNSIILTLMETVSLPSNVKFFKSGFKNKSYNTGLTDFGSRPKGFLSPAILYFFSVNDFDKNNRKHLQKY